MFHGIGERFAALGQEAQRRHAYTFDRDSMAKLATQDLDKLGFPDNVAQQLASGTDATGQPDPLLNNYLLDHARWFQGKPPRLQVQNTPEQGLVFSATHAPLDEAERAQIDGLWQVWQAVAKPPLTHRLFNALVPHLSPAAANRYLALHADALIADHSQTAFPAHNVAAAIVRLLAGPSPTARHTAPLNKGSQSALEALLQSIDPVAYLRSALDRGERARKALKPNTKEQETLAHIAQLKSLQALAMERAQIDLASEAERHARLLVDQFPRHNTLRDTQAQLTHTHEAGLSRLQLQRMQNWFQLSIEKDTSGAPCIRLELERGGPTPLDDKTRVEAGEHFRAWLRAQLRDPQGLPWTVLQTVIAKVADFLGDPALLTPDDGVDLARLEALRSGNKQPLRLALLDAQAGEITGQTLDSVLSALVPWSKQADPKPEELADLLDSAYRLLPPKTARTEPLHLLFLRCWAQLAQHDRVRGERMWASYLSQHPLPEEHAARRLVPLLLSLPEAEGSDTRQHKQRAEKRADLFKALAWWLPGTVKTRALVQPQAWFSGQSQEEYLDAEHATAQTWLKPIKGAIDMLRQATSHWPKEQRRTMLEQFIQDSSQQLAAWRSRAGDDDSVQTPLELTALLGAARDLLGIRYREQMNVRLPGNPEVDFFQEWAELRRHPMSSLEHHKSLEGFQRTIAVMRVDDDPFDPQTRLLADHIERLVKSPKGQ